ncbi:uncharacterized protein LOC142340137 isoform X2 [Convolutriloba macropyga]|uniref:uncharacterized protein LOC142340137 isoform X2 n=1 Tax=Convolutriloba macropyga TaxID=536237 RepID=UPI003F51F9A4
MMIPKVKFVVLVLLLLPPVPLSLDLDCLKEMSSADGICLLNDNCCRSLHTDKCRAELIARDEPSMAVGFLPNSLVFDRQANFLCIVGLETTPGEHMKDFIGAEVHVRKEHLWSSVQETTKMTFILTQPLRGAVPHDVNPLENMTMCLRLGTELDSLSPHVFITVELIPLNPDINEYPLTYKPIPFICELDRVIIEQKGECRLHSLYREPHQCSIETTAKAVAPSRNLPGVTSEPKPLIITEETKMWFEDRVWILIVVIIILLVSTLTSLAFIIFICQRVQTNEGRLRELEYRANPIPSNRYEVVGQSLPREPQKLSEPIRLIPVLHLDLNEVMNK